MLFVIIVALFVTYSPFAIYHVKTVSQSDTSFILQSAYGQTPDTGSSDPSMTDNSTNISNSTDASGMDNGTDITNQNDSFNPPGTTPDVSSDLGNPAENTTTTNNTQANEIANQAVPEFGSTAMMVLLISMTVLILYATKSINKLF